MFPNFHFECKWGSHWMKTRSFLLDSHVWHVISFSRGSFVMLRPFPLRTDEVKGEAKGKSQKRLRLFSYFQREMDMSSQNTASKKRSHAKQLTV